MTVRLSNSEIQTFKDCRRKWWLAYYRRLQPLYKETTGALALGSRVHEALDMYYSKDIPLLVAHAELVEKDRLLVADHMFGTETLDKEADLGRIMLEGYLQWIEEEGIDMELEFVSSEEKISASLFNGEVELQGKLDMRVRRRADGVRLFRDFKTVGGSLSDFANLAQTNEQILTYMLLESMKVDEPERCEGGIFTMLKKVRRTAAAKPPFYDQITVRHNVFALRTFWKRIHGTIADMMRVRKALDDGEDHAFVAYPRPTRDCKWKCQFSTICPMFDDGSAVEEAISDMFTEGDPYDYYNTNESKGSE